jgi:hypothetical protein
MPRMPLADRFWSKVDKSGDCWEWTGALDKLGYGDFRQGQKHIKSHRVSWELANGKIPEGICVLHKCDNPPCINPSHLFLGTHADNMQDCTNKGRRSNPPVRMGAGNNKAKLDNQKVLEIREVAGTMSNRAIAAKFNVDPSVIGDVIARRTWRHV